MKKLIFTLVPIIFLLIGGCSDDSGNGTTDPFGGGGGGGTGNVTFTIGQGQADGPGRYTCLLLNQVLELFVTEYTCQLPAQQFPETIDMVNSQFHPVMFRGGWNSRQMSLQDRSVDLLFNLKGTTTDAE